jgi:transposase IS204/IS1001/IS1096/IS1165 family protein
MTEAGLRVNLDVSTRDEKTACPGCGTLSRRVHSRYRRRLSDTAITGREAHNSAITTGEGLFSLTGQTLGLPAPTAHQR